MKNFFIALLFLIAYNVAAAQFRIPNATSNTAPVVVWRFIAKKTADKTYVLNMIATIGSGYHLYAQINNAEGPVPTTFTFIKNPLLNYLGKVKENGKLISKMEPVWGFKVNYFENKVAFEQTVKSKVSVPVTAKGTVNFMVCNDKKCFPPKDVNFDIKLASN